MSTSQSHKKLQRKVAGPKGQTEKKIYGGKRLDAKNPTTNIATEVERSGNIKQALQRLKTQKNAKKQLLVPNNQLDKAKKIAEKMKMNAIIQNLSRTKRRFVKK